MKIFTQENSQFFEKLNKLVFPIAFQQFMLACVNASDAFMLGFVSQTSLSASSLAGQIIFIFNLIIGGLAAGTSVLAAQYFGKDDKVSVERVFAYVVKIAFIISLFFFFVSIFIPNYLMFLFTNEKELINEGIIYLRYVSVSFIFIAISQIFLCILKNSNLAVKSMMISSISVVLNILLNAIFIFGLLGFPKMGIAGAALATSISKLFELVWAYCETLPKERIKLRIKYIINSTKVLVLDFWKYTLPILGNFLSWGIGFSMYSVIMGHLGSDAVASNSIANIVKNLIVCYCIGLANGGSILVGNELGKGNLEQAKKYGRLLCRLAVISGLASGMILLAVTPFVLSFVILTPLALYYLKWMMILCALYMVGKAYNVTTIAGIFQAGGDTRFGLICDTVTMWCFAVPAGFIAAFYFKLPVVIVFLIINFDEIIKLPVVIHHYRKYGWVKNITRQIYD